MITRIRLKIMERLAFNAFALSKFETALKHFESILRLDGQRKGIRLNMGLSQLSLRRFNEAVDSFREERERHGDSPALRKGMAEAFYRMGDRLSALEAYELAASRESSDKDSRFFAMRISICAAPELFQQAMQARSLMKEGDKLMLQKRFEDAEGIFKQVHDLDATHFQALNNIGAIQVSRKDYDNAKKNFLKADELVDLPVIKQNLVYLKHVRNQEKH
ncbi:tetratricopeptide repeat protein [Salidesulfovibrio onnuriiensis]|uniref:tetratricopeptide repeat protein n=1 Tax=Salidesulfovibrio onnuriiensis TaxID=2583823 RepID=UPI0016502BC3|nr:tetratricopeptide repeat protein [Salidesulfovibrio onnuriiensis]